MSALFPRAHRHPAPVLRKGAGVREGRTIHPWSERHLQCVWFDSALRPVTLRTRTGEQVIVEDPGAWNLEAGPDFLGAAIRVEPGGRRMAGDVEVHIHPSDWRAHRHTGDPRYSRVRIHVSYFPGDAADVLPPGAVQLALRDELSALPGFDFGSIDVGAYPFAARTKATPCGKLLAQWTADEIEAVLDAAGEERLRRKSARFRARMDAVGAEQTLYEEILCALGYKHNKTPFRRLAEAVPLARLREEAQGNPVHAYALFAGVAGLLPDRERAGWSVETRKFIRQLWDFWWKRREQWESRIIPADAWRTAGLRPANHPARRLMAAAALFARREDPSSRWARIAREQPETCEAAISRDIQTLDGGYWSRRLSLSGKPQNASVALIGKSRADEIMVNVLVPYLAAAGATAAFQAGLLDRLAAESDNGIARQTAFALLGADHPPSLYRSGLRRQGLIQVFQDFCLNDRSRCATCEFPALLSAHRA